MKKFLLIIIIGCCSHSAFAQAKYDQALGLKFPLGFSVTYKKFISDSHNLEGQATFWNKGFRVVGLYEFNFYNLDVDGLSWYVGPGAHLGFWKKEFQDNSSIDFGIDGTIGLDYKFSTLPINLSIDWQPSIALIGSTGFTPSFAGIGVRYTF